MLPSYDLLLEDDAVLEVGRLRIRTIATPGHTPGSMCFAVEGTPLLLSGDTLFPGGPGNTSFEGGDFPTIIRSIERPALLPLRPRHRGAARATAPHHHRHRVPAPPGVDRPGLVSRSGQPPDRHRGASGTSAEAAVAVAMAGKCPAEGHAAGRR